MQISLHEILVKDIIEGYVDNQEVSGVNGRHRRANTSRSCAENRTGYGVFY
jgi:hypothetical protein